MVRPAPIHTRVGGLYLLLALCIGGLCIGVPVQAQEVTIGKASTRTLHCMGQSWKLGVITTSQADEVMVKADDPTLRQAARALGRDLTWSRESLTLTGDEGRSLALDQSQLLGRTLSVPPRVIENAVHIPLSSLEELLSCRVTVKPGERGALYLEPTLREIGFVQEGPTGTVLRVVTTVPVRKKVLNLKNPARTVIDLVGVAPPRNQASLQHPVLGEIRIAQNQPAPSITRIVIPTPSGVRIETPRGFDLFEHQARLAWRPGQGGAVTTAASGQPTPAPPAPQPKSPPKAPVNDPVGENPDRRPVTATTGTTAPASNRPLLLSTEWQGQQLVMKFSQPVTYRWSRLSEGQHRFVLDFPGAVFPDKRNTLSSPVAAVQSVRIVQNMPEPNPVVRLVCDLQGPSAVTPVHGAEPTELRLEFPGRMVAGGALKGSGHTAKTPPVASSSGGRGKTICLDAGHGGSDPGAVNRAYGLSEKQVTLDITLRLAELLKAEGWNVVLTRSVDRDVSYAGSSDKEELGARSGLANEQGADLFVSIHCNSAANPSVGGTSIHWYKSDDYQLAKSLENELLVATGRSHRGLIKDRFFVLAHTQMPAVLIETAFLSNPTEGKLLGDPEYRAQIARGLAAGLRLYASRHFPMSAAGK